MTRSLDSTTGEQERMNPQNILSLPEQDVLQQLRSSEEGLSQRDADERRATYGLNVLE